MAMTPTSSAGTLISPILASSTSQMPRPSKSPGDGFSHQQKVAQANENEKVSTCAGTTAGQGIESGVSFAAVNRGEKGHNIPQSDRGGRIEEPECDSCRPGFVVGVPVLRSPYFVDRRRRRLVLQTHWRVGTSGILIRTRIVAKPTAEADSSSMSGN